MSIQGNINTAIGTAAVLNKLGEPAREQRKEAERLARTGETIRNEAVEAGKEFSETKQYLDQQTKDFKKEVDNPVTSFFGSEYFEQPYNQNIDYDTLENAKRTWDKIPNLWTEASDIYKQAYIKTGNKQYKEIYESAKSVADATQYAGNNWYEATKDTMKERTMRNRAFKNLYSDIATQTGINSATEAQKNMIKQFEKMDYDKKKQFLKQWSKQYNDYYNREVNRGVK